MKKYVFVSCMMLGLLTGNSSFSQDKKEKEKEKMDEQDEIIIKRKGDKDSKVTIEINNGEVKVNGKSIDEYDDENISVRRRKTPRVIVANGSRFRSTVPGSSFGGALNYYGDGPLAFSSGNKAFLGVTTDDVDEGARIMSVSENSAAEKAGLKKGDIITKIGEHVIDDAGDLTRAIGKFKPEDKVTIMYKRDGKENKATATLGKNKNSGIVRSYGLTSPDLQGFRTYPNGDAFAPLQELTDHNFNWNEDRNNNHLFEIIGGRPRLGIKAQDTEDGKGVKVLDVADESLAEKAGIKEGDIITEFDGKTINSADELAEVAQGSREKPTVKLQITRDGKSQTIEIKTPKKLKTANL